jgi:uncharacterized lipoprotein YddW (UPF0748 family)
MSGGRKVTVPLKLVLILVMIIVHFAGDYASAREAAFKNKRAILDGDIGEWTKKEELDERLQRIKKAGFNVYMPAVWFGRGTTWPSRHASWDFTLKPNGTEHRDPLRYAITKAHELGIEVHPWFTLVFRWNHSFMPEYGLEGVSEGPHAAFDVHNPAFRAFMTQLVQEVASNYEVDGINLDFARAMGLCGSSTCEQEYQALYNRSLSIDSLAFKISPKQVPTLIQYQEAAVTALIKSISDSLRAVKPSLLISVDGHPELVQYMQGQNTVEWVKTGLIDVILQMDYHPKINVSATDAVRSRMNDPEALTLLISNMAYGADRPGSMKPYPRSGPWMANTISMIRTRWPNTGIAVYFYKYLTDEQIAALKEGPFSTLEDTAAPSPPSRIRVN